MNAITKNPPSLNPSPREVFAVEGVHVFLDAIRGWHCSCPAAERGLPCSHIEQAKRFRCMRGAKRNGGTPEKELTAEQLQSLYIDAAVEHTHFRADELVTQSARKRRALGRAASVLGVAVGVAVLSSTLTYLAISPDGQTVVHASHSVRSPAPATVRREMPAPPPVRFVNPFDETEVFEFPPGTSEQDAREAVARILLDRARERLSSSDPSPRWNDRRVPTAETLRSAHRS